MIGGVIDIVLLGRAKRMTSFLVELTITLLAHMTATHNAMLISL